MIAKPTLFSSPFLSSVPCVPTDVVVEIDCSENQAVVSWTVSKGTLSYVATAQSTQGSLSFCESTDPMCTLTNLTCGQSYSVQVVSQDDICSSLPSPATSFQSGRTSRWIFVFFLDVTRFGLYDESVFHSFFLLLVPCTPNIGSVVLDCFTNSALLDWTHAEGALNYTSTAQSSSGHVSSCSSNFTNCELQDLQCGQTYSVATVGSNEKCSSPPSTRLQVESGKPFKKNINKFNLDLRQL